MAQIVYRAPTVKIERVPRTLIDGQKRTYIYLITYGTRRLIRVTSYVSQTQYRSKHIDRIVQALIKRSSVLVVGEGGSGKTFVAEGVAERFENLRYIVVFVVPATPKQILLSIAEQIGIDPVSLEGKVLTIQELQDEIADFVEKFFTILIFDNAHRLQISLRSWLEHLHSQGQPMLLLATLPPKKDFFLKLPRIELKPLPDRAIREIMQEIAKELNIELSTAQLAELQQRCAGNPMLAERAVKEDYLGLEPTSPDHTQWLEGTMLLLGVLMILVIVRFIGLGFNSQSLYLIGGIITVVVSVVRLMLYSLPRKSGRLGQ